MIKGVFFHNDFRKKGLLSFCFLTFIGLGFSSLWAQKDSTGTAIPTFSITVKNSFFTTDNLQNTYLFDENQEVIKYNSEGKETYRYSNTRLDEPTYIDATDPFNLLVFYKNYQTVVLLDRTMNPTATFNFINFDLFNINAVGISSNNSIWVYDELNFRLKKIDRNGKVVQESEDLGLLLDMEIQPNLLIEREQMVFVNDPNIGLLVFDFFGQYMKILDIKNLTDFQIIENRLVFQENENLKSFHLKSLLEQPLNLPFTIEKSEKVRIEKGSVFVGNEEGVFIYKLGGK